MRAAAAAGRARQVGESSQVAVVLSRAAELQQLGQLGAQHVTRPVRDGSLFTGAGGNIGDGIVTTSVGYFNRVGAQQMARQLVPEADPDAALLSEAGLSFEAELVPEADPDTALLAEAGLSFEADSDMVVLKK